MLLYVPIFLETKKLNFNYQSVTIIHSVLSLRPNDFRTGYHQPIGCIVLLSGLSVVQPVVFRLFTGKLIDFKFGLDFQGVIPIHYASAQTSLHF